MAPIRRCAASGSPNPSLVWLGPGGLELGRGLSLLVTGTREVTRSREVTCSADNGIGDPANMTFTILVTCEYVESRLKLVNQYINLVNLFDFNLFHVWMTSLRH